MMSVMGFEDAEGADCDGAGLAEEFDFFFFVFGAVFDLVVLLRLLFGVGLGCGLGFVGACLALVVGAFLVGSFGIKLTLNYR